MSTRPTAAVRGGASPVASSPAAARRLRRWFDIGAWFKGVEGAIEIVAGAWIALDHAALGTLLVRLAAKDLLHDPHDRIASTLRHLAHALDGNVSFPAIYLIAHGVVKVLLAIGLLRDYRAAYPLAIVTLGALAAYQLYRYTHTHAVMLPVLAALDLAIAWLVWREGRQRRLERVASVRS
jgi:uncharacterized membrane protein